jgi:threonine/homoserine/homoserine lactone efflux protein
MDTFLTITSIISVLAIGVVSPGPSFLLVARTAVAYSRGAAMVSAFGMAVGATILSIAALLGLHALFNQIPAAYIGLKIFGGLYLIYLAVKTWRSATSPLQVGVATSNGGAGRPRHFWLAAGTMLSNPKAAIQYGVIFAAMLPRAPSATLVVVLPIAVFAIEATWYLVVALVLSAPSPRGAYLRLKTQIDRTVGVVLSLLGVRLLLSSK